MDIVKIGTMRSCFKAKFGTPRQSQIASQSKGYIELEDSWDPEAAVRGLEGFSHVWVVFWFHDNSAFTYKPVVHPPRLGRKGVGIFATRSPMRPNPIGLSLLKLDKVDKNRIYVSGIDIIDGTPILDVKPYIAEYDSVPFSTNGWLGELECQKLDVEFSQDALRDLKNLSRPNLKEILVDILREDIRNRNDKHPKNEKKQLGFYYDDLNVVFLSSESVATIVKIEQVNAKLSEPNPCASL